MITMYCDICEKEITGEPYYLEMYAYEVWAEDETKKRPCLKPKEICALCMASIKNNLREAALQDRKMEK